MIVRLLFLTLLFFVFIFASVFGQEKHITLGSGGGVTGSATVFKITSSGKVFKGSGLGEIKYTECAKIRKAQARRFISSATQALNSAGDFSHPGNMYYFLTASEGDQPKKITWGDTSHPVNDDIRKLYTEIQTIVSTLKYKPLK